MKKLAPLIAVEGLDASGKATQVKTLYDNLRKRGYKVFMLDFPQYNRNPAGTRLYDVLRGAAGNILEVDNKMLMSLYAADRLFCIPTIKKAQEDYDIVLFDRSIGANVIFGRARAESEQDADAIEKYIYELEHKLYGFPYMDKIFFLNASHEAQMKFHGDKKRDADQNEDNKKLQDDVRNEAVRQCQEKKYWTEVKVDADGNIRTIEDIGEEILTQVLPFLDKNQTAIDFEKE